MDKTLTTKKLVNLHQQSEARFNTLASRVQVSYDDGKKSQSVTVNLRMEKDKTIWVSASILGISLAKLLITPQNVSYYETVNKTYFEGDFTLLSQWLGVTIDFNMAQNILLGSAVFDLDDKKYNATIFAENYKLSPKNEQEIMHHLFLLNPAHYRMASQQVVQPNEQRVLKIDYIEYQTLGTQVYPKVISMHASEIDQQTSITLVNKKIDENPNVSFPFTIPRGYKEIKIEE